jgi:hypothetical protein
MTELRSREPVLRTVARAVDVPVILIGLLLAFEAAAYALPGRAYLHVVGLSDASAPIGLGVLLHPAFLVGAALFVYQAPRHRRTTIRRSRADVFVLGAFFWLSAATLSCIANYERDQVLLTYLMVFVSGGLAYLSASCLELSTAATEVLFAAMMLGALFPLLGGIREYVAEWGVPNANILMTAILDLPRMELYESATFGNRGNTAAFLMLIGPPAVWMLANRSRHWMMRCANGVFLSLVVANLLIIQVRAAFIAWALVCALIWRFRTGSRLAYVAFSVTAALTLLAVVQATPDVGDVLVDRFQPVLTMEVASDNSLLERSEAMQEGLNIAKSNWLLGVGPGGALTVHSKTSAHQFFIQQFMETGIVGLVGTILVSTGIILYLLKTVAEGASQEHARMRFGLLLGPTGYLLYGFLANLTVNIGYVNTWSAICAVMLGLYRSASAHRPAQSPKPIVAS